VLLIQALLVAAVLLAWQYLPTIDAISEHVRFLNRFYISSPTEIAGWLRRLAVGDDTRSVWPYLYTTLYSATVGTAIGVAIGAVGGLILSESEILAAVFRPILVFLNSIPRIALIPVIILITGPTRTSSVVNVTLVVVFLVFFNAFEGGRSVRPAMLEYARLLGARRHQLMLYLRTPYVILWTFAVIPNAISFGLIVAVANELLAGVQGIGVLLYNATLNAQAGLTFALIVILATSGLLLTAVASLLRTVIVRRLGGSEALKS
jgi:NitT/TauT family transport system permease protein